MSVSLGRECREHANWRHLAGAAYRPFGMEWEEARILKRLAAYQPNTRFGRNSPWAISPMATRRPLDVA